jgi:hypothetical protein
MVLGVQHRTASEPLPAPLSAAELDGALREVISCCRAGRPHTSAIRARGRSRCTTAAGCLLPASRARPSASYRQPCSAQRRRSTSRKRAASHTRSAHV